MITYAAYKIIASVTVNFVARKSVSCFNHGLISDYFLAIIPVLSFI